MEKSKTGQKEVEKVASFASDSLYSAHGYYKVHISELYFPMEILVPELIKKDSDDGDFATYSLNTKKDLVYLHSLKIEYAWILTDAVIPKNPDGSAAIAKAAGGKFKSRAPASKIDSNNAAYEPLSKELARSKTFFKQSYKQIRLVLDSIRQNSELIMDEVTLVVDDITSSVARNPNALLCMRGLQNADEYTYFHSINVSILASIFAQYLGYSAEEIRRISLAGILHDIGKQKIPLSVLNATRKLTDKEFEIMKLHPQLARKILNNGEGLPEGVIEAVSCHHEKFDGTGYPYGLKGDAIHPYAMILSLADVYDALTSERPYKSAFNQNQSAAIIYTQKNTSFSAEMVNKFIQCFGVYPIGALVLLSNNRLAIVYENNSDDLLHPKILQLSGSFDRFAPTRINPIDLREVKDTLRIVSCEETKELTLDLQKILQNFA